MSVRILRVLSLLVAAVLALAACRYSPWETEMECSDRLEHNLSRLQAIEAANPDRERFNVALITDIHNHVSDLETVVQRINARDDVSFVMILGDITDSGLNLEFEWSCKALKHLDVPRFYVIGNHDAISFGKQIFFDNFAPYQYTFAFADTRFVVYNDNVLEFPGVPDFEWIARASAVAPGETRDHTIAAAHIPPIVDVHDAAGIATLQEFLSNSGFGYTLHGHRHKFDLWQDAEGVQHFVVGEVQPATYGLMTVERGGPVTFSRCAATCEPMGL